ncbi:PleD family two-component system response regulator [Rhizobium sp. SSA_523]|uniref:response regulator n=1 Tax=Rhizobium sp. SSA_523 TaxID=2952477 RepID=UPI0020911B7C|nr:response regulator [Rhizobium sp. SSA_523]MCO5732065.1 response regulator [Rhizobium sp. SSA_523]WKC22598.1 response regulator [Rhizobium sp. SSA_523]
MRRLMIADSSDIVRTVAKRILSELGFMVAETSSDQQALRACSADMPDVLIVDAHLEGALELITAVRALEGSERVRIYYCLIEGDLKKMMAGKRAGADDFLLKPFDRKILSAVFGTAARVA